MLVTMRDSATQVRRTGGPGISPAGSAATRLPAGHPEGFLEGFANVYRGVAAAIRGQRAGIVADGDALDFPTIDDGDFGSFYFFLNNFVYSVFVFFRCSCVEQLKMDFCYR